MTLLFRLSTMIYEPLFWLLVTLFASGIEEYLELRRGILYVSKGRRLVSAAANILIALICFWFYWLRPGASMRLIELMQM